MTDSTVTYLVGACCAVVALAAFLWLIAVPGLVSYRRVWERGAALVLSFYILVALVAAGVVVGVVIVAYWPRVF